MNYKNKSYFFCGVGGSGMSALAVAMIARGAVVYGSDRNYDRDLFPDHFKTLIDKGVQMMPQDGSAVSNDLSYLVVSSAIEASIPDVKAAQEKNIPIIKRAELLAEIANASKSITVAGTNGKSTVTGMIGWMLSDCGYDPSILNGGGMLNFNRQNAVIGESDLMVLETDESDGSVKNFKADIAVLTNISEDHKDMDELERIFETYLQQAKTLVINSDCPVLKKRFCNMPNASCYSMDDLPLSLKLLVPGEHNISNALAALKVAELMGIDEDKAISALNKFIGITSRLEVIGHTSHGVTIIDDFGHNPDKITASLKTLQESGRRLLIMYQPHGFGPLKRQKKALIEIFSTYLNKDDHLYMPEAYYAGGTADRTNSSKEVVDALMSEGVNAQFYNTKVEIEADIIKTAKDGDLICIMGARDDSLREMARNLYERLK